MKVGDRMFVGGAVRVVRFVGEWNHGYPGAIVLGPAVAAERDELAMMAAGERVTKAIRDEKRRQQLPEGR